MSLVNRPTNRRIAQQYRELFHQESVLVTTSPADAEFVEAASD